MNFWSVSLISLAVGLILVMGGALVMYVGSLVKSAYELKVEIQGEVAAGMQRLEEETDKKTRWMKREIVEEVEKTRAALQTDTHRKMTEVAELLGRRVAELEEANRASRQEVGKVLEGLRQDILLLDQRQRALRPAPSAPSPTEDPKPSAPDQPA